MRTNDNELLRRYVHDRSEAAFAELVERYLGLAYSAALRQMDGDTQAAEDVTQAVFVDLARKGGRLLRHPTLTGWIYTSTRYLAANARRAARRRRVHEQSAQMVNELLRPDGLEQDWTALRPVLDEAMHDLTPGERDAILWRYFEKHAFAEIGLRLGVRENAARMRVERALDKLRGALARRGVTSAGVVLAELVGSRAVGSAPAGLAGRVCRASYAAAGTGGIAALVAVWLATLKAKSAVGFLALAAMLGLVLWNWPTGGASRPPELTRVAARGTSAGQLRPRTTSTNELAVLGGAPRVASSVSGGEEASLRLQLVAQDTGQAVPEVEVRCRYDVGSQISYTQIPSDPRGMIDAVFPNQVTRIEFLAQVEGFAETRLVWRPEHGEVIPAEYAWRLARAVPLGGRVVDANGTPVSGATVEGSCPNDPAAETQRETHLAEFKAQTDDNGRWQNRRSAPELIRSLRLQASHPDFGPSAAVEVSSDVELERQLRERTHTFHLGAAVVVSGWVMDPEHNPIADASVQLGDLRGYDSKQTTAADGSFSFSGVPIGMHVLTGNAEGFAMTSQGIAARPKSEPIRLVLSCGKPLAVRVTDGADQPIPRARVWVNPRVAATRSPDDVIPRLRLDGNTDAEGRVSFAHVPELDIEVCAAADGYMELFGLPTRPGGPELVLRLGPELVVTGTVRDRLTGQPIPRFTILTGRPEPRGPYWSTLDRFRFGFEGGSFRYAYHESVVCDGTNAGYVLKFEAEGYAPFISRAIASDERMVQLEVTLLRASMRQLAVLNPDGSPAAWADVAFPELARGNSLALAPGGFARRGDRSDDALRRTDDQGRVDCLDEKARRVIAANAAGYAEVDLAKQTDGRIQLLPWGRVEGILSVTGGQQADHEVYFDYEGRFSLGGLRSEFGSSYRIKPDSDGRFVFPLAPPGRHQIHELIPASGLEGREWKWGRQAEFEVHAGKTVQVTLVPVPTTN